MKTTFALAFAIVLSAAAQTDISQLEGPRQAWLRLSPVLPAADSASPPDPVWSQGAGGGKVALLRLASPGAAAYRLHFDEFHAPRDARVFLYGIGPDGAVASAFGPYQGAGPTGTGEFLSRTIAGVEAVIEVQSAEAIGWPFHLGGTAPIDAAGLARLKQVGDPSITETDAQRRPPAGVPFPCTVGASERWCEMTLDRLVFEGDIIVDQAGEENGKSRRQAIGITGAQYRWPRGQIPYTVNANLYPDPESGNPDSRLTEAILHFDDMLPGLLVRRTNEPDYVEFRRTEESTCSSRVGRQTLRQYVNIADGCSSGSIVHEIAHAAGLWHEQSREDRDNNVTVNWVNIEAGKAFNFDKHVDDGDDIGAYDFGSIMHYGRFAFSSNGRATLTTIPAGIAIGQRTSLSAGDVAGIKKVQCTYTLDPAVIQVPFEGGEYQVGVTSPRYCSWTARSGSFWVDVGGGGAGAGNGVISLSVERNRLLVRREATVTIGDRRVTVLQGAAIR